MTVACNLAGPQPAGAGLQLPPWVAQEASIPAWPPKAFEFATLGMWFKFLKSNNSNNNKSNPIYGGKTLLKSERIKTFIGHKYITYTLQIQLGITYSIVFAKSIH